MVSRLRRTSNFKRMFVLFTAHLLLGAECFSNGCSYSNPTIVKCVNKNLARIPNWIPSNVTDLDLSHNPHLKIQERSLLRFTNLTKLSLRHCHLNKPFRIPETLVRIDLSYNLLSIESVAAIFKNKDAYNIIYISVNSNNLQLDGNLSMFPRSVQFLHLSGNKMKRVQAEDFKEFQNLLRLELANTGIQSIAKGAFDGLSHLYYINLNENRIGKLPRRIFQYCENLTSINVESNYLTELPDLTGIRRLNELNLKKNRIKIVNGNSFGVHDISKIDLSSNRIETFDFTGIKYFLLDMANNSIRKIKQGSFGPNPLISGVILSENNITSLENNCFRGIQGVVELHLQRNNLQQIENGIFRNMSIQKLFLFNNNLTDIAGLLEGMKTKPHLLLLFGNPRISTMRTSDFQDMTSSSQVHISCRSFQTFSSPFLIKAKLTCSPSTNLMIQTATQGLVGNGFKCFGGLPYKCYPCKLGEYDTAIQPYHGMNCEPCPDGGFYQDEIASTNCKRCPLGQYVPPDKGPGKSPLDCLTCPKGTNTNTSAGYRACPCLPGYSRTYRFGGCEKCTLGGFQCTKDYPELRKGYWMSWKEMASCKDSFKSFIANLDTKNASYDTRTSHFKCNLPIAHKCPIPRSCKGGVEALCERGYTGVLCSVCDAGYMREFNKCLKCPSPVVSLAECIAYFLSFVFLCWLMSKLANVTLASKVNEKNERTFADLIQSSLKILMGFYQVLVRIIKAFSSIQWPSTLTHAVKVFEFIQLSVLKVPSLHCIRSDWRLNALREFWITLIAIAAVPSLILIYGVLSASIPYFCASKEMFRKKQMITIKNCLQSMVLFFFATYPFISTNVFHVLPFSCHRLCTAKENGHCLNMISYLRNDYSVECPNAVGHNQFNVNYAYVSLLLPFGLPCLLLYLLWRFAPKKEVAGPNQRNLSIECDDSQENEDDYVFGWQEYNARSSKVKSVAKFALKMTYGNYKASCWYWEFIEMIRKLVMVIVSSFLLQNVKIGLYSNILLSILFVLLHARKWPMKDSFDNYMQLLALVSVTVNLCYSVTKTSSIGDEDIMENDKDVFALGLMLVSLNSLLVILIVGRFLKEVVVKCLQKLHRCRCR